MVRRKIDRKKHGGAVKALHYSPAMRLFVEEEMTHQAISKRLGVPYYTIRRWSQDGKWKKHREEFRQSSASTVIQAKMILQDVVKRIDAKRNAGKEITNSEVDKMAKCAATIERLEVIITPRRAFVAFASKFSEWCREQFNDEEFIALLSDAIQGYGSVILETDGHA